MDQTALFKLTYGLYVVSSRDGTQRGGCVVNTLLQVTSQPVQLSVTVNKDNYTCGLIERSGRFTAVALDKSSTLASIGPFGFRSGRDVDKFEGIGVGFDNSYIPYPSEHICARFSCKVVGKIDLGTHILFVGEADEAENVGDGEPLTYGYYREVIKGKTPKNAPSFHG